MFYAIIAYLKHEKMNVNVADVLAAKTVIVMVFFLKSVRAMICDGVPEESTDFSVEDVEDSARFPLHFSVKVLYKRVFQWISKDCCTSKWSKSSCQYPSDILFEVTATPWFARCPKAWPSCTLLQVWHRGQWQHFPIRDDFHPSWPRFCWVMKPSSQNGLSACLRWWCQSWNLVYFSEVCNRGFDRFWVFMVKLYIYIIYIVHCLVTARLKQPSFYLVLLFEPWPNEYLRYIAACIHGH